MNSNLENKMIQISLHDLEKLCYEFFKDGFTICKQNDSNGLEQDFNDVKQFNYLKYNILTILK